MSTAAERSDIAVLQVEMKEVKATLGRIETKLDTQVSNSINLLTQKQFDTYKTEVDERFKATNRNKWMAVILSVLFTAIVEAMAYTIIFGGHR